MVGGHTCLLRPHLDPPLIMKCCFRHNATHLVWCIQIECQELVSELMCYCLIEMAFNTSTWHCSWIYTPRGLHRILKSYGKLTYTPTWMKDYWTTFHQTQVKSLLHITLLTYIETQCSKFCGLRHWNTTQSLHTCLELISSQVWKWIRISLLILMFSHSHINWVVC